MGGRTLGDMRRIASDREGETFTLKNSHRTWNNTLEYTCKDGRVCLQHHNTRILTLFPNGDIEVSPHRWETATTRARLRNALRGRGIYIVGGRYGWMMCHSWDGPHVRIDGAILLPEGHLPDPPEGKVWDYNGDAVEQSEFDRQRRFRLTARVRRDLHSTWRRGHGDAVGGRYNDLIRRALGWAGHTQEGIEFILDSVYVETPDVRWDGTPDVRVTAFEPAIKVIGHEVFAFLKANPSALDYGMREE